MEKIKKINETEIIPDKKKLPKTKEEFIDFLQEYERTKLTISTFIKYYE